MTRLTELAPKKESNCNVVAIWPRHMILLVISSNDILLSLLIALIYCLDGSFFWYTKPHSSIVGNRFSYIALFRSPPAAILFVKKLTWRYSICWEALPLSSYYLLIYWETTFLDLILLGIYISSHSLTIASQWLNYYTDQSQLGQ